jgi:hypothetical protein
MSSVPPTVLGATLRAVFKVKSFEPHLPCLSARVEYEVTMYIRVFGAAMLRLFLPDIKRRRIRKI